jgi:hypothetical protein
MTRKRSTKVSRSKKRSTAPKGSRSRKGSRKRRSNKRSTKVSRSKRSRKFGKGKSAPNPCILCGKPSCQHIKSVDPDKFKNHSEYLGALGANIPLPSSKYYDQYRCKQHRLKKMTHFRAGEYLVSDNCDQ